MQLQTVTDLVNKLFTYYDCNLNKLDWDSKIDEYVDAINDLIGYDTDLDELYQKIRQDYPYRKLPLPYDIKKIISKKQHKEEVKNQTEHPGNGKLIVIACYKNGEIQEIRDYIVHNTYTTKNVKDVTTALKTKFESVKVYEFRKGSTLMRDIVYIPLSYDLSGNVLEFKTQRIA